MDIDYWLLIIKVPDSLNKRDWNDFVLANQGSFLQSWEWGEFQESIGRRVRRLVSADNNRLAQFIEFSLPFGKKYWYCPRGPIAKELNLSPEERKKDFQDSLFRIIDLIKGKGVIFFRIGYPLEWSERKEGILESFGFSKLPYDIEPSQTLILDITKPEEELLAQMHEKWRYNIRLAERKGVMIKNYQAPISNDQFETFYRLVDQGTSERKNIRHHDKEHYRKQMEINSEDIQFVLFVAEYENKVIAANIMVFFGQTATYLHGATDNEYRNVMAPHLLQWEQIKEAKQRGCTEYDFWGIVNEHTKDRRGPSWEGFTRFKKGFGGREVNYIGYWDYPLNKPWYFLYRLVQKFRR